MEPNVEKSDEKMKETEEKFEAFTISGALPLSFCPPEGHVQDINGELYGLPKGWSVERRPRTNSNYAGKVDQFYYEPGTYNQFRSRKKAFEHLDEAEAKQNDGQQLQQEPKTDHGQVSGQKHEQKPEQYENKAGTKRRVAEQQRNQQQTPPKPENDQEQAAQQNPVVEQNADHPKASDEKPSDDSSNELGRKRKRASGVEFKFANPPKKIAWVVNDAKNEGWKPIVGDKRVPKAVKDSWAKSLDKIHHKNTMPNAEDLV